MRVLIVEDEPGIVRMLERGLAAHGHRCISADNGDDGARLAVGEDVDLVLLDIMLPGLSGQEVLKRIRYRRPGLPIVGPTRNSVRVSAATREVFSSFSYAPRDHATAAGSDRAPRVLCWSIGARGPLKGHENAPIPQD